MSACFFEFQVRDYDGDEEGNDNKDGNGGEAAGALERASVAFSIMCIFLTVMYASFAIFAFISSSLVLSEFEADSLMDDSYYQHNPSGPNAQSGYIDQRFDVRPNARTNNGSGFVAPPPSSSVRQSHFTTPGSTHFTSPEGFVSPQLPTSNFIEDNPFVTNDSGLS